MDAPIARLMVEGFCKGYEKQRKKEELDAEEIVNTINPDALKALCTRYDNKSGIILNRGECEGAVVFAFFEELKADVEKRKEQEEKRTL